LTPSPNEFAAKVERLLADADYQEKQRLDELERQAELRRQQRARLRRMAWRAVQALKDPKLAPRIEPELRSVGGGVEALASWEAALRAGRELNALERDNVKAALASTPLDWALRRVSQLIDEAERETAKGPRR
jgi:hypothetical protein